MKKFAYLILFGLVVCACLVAGSYMIQASTKQTDVPESARFGRACIMPIGGWTIINCSNSSAATSAQLTANTRYVVQCGDDSYIATGDEVTDSADSSDGWLPSGSWLELMTTDDVRYISCLNKNSDSDCRYFECQ